MLDLIRGGNTYSLDDGTYAYLTGDDGWGAAPLHRLIERGPLQHGDTDRGFRLDPRIGSLVLFLNGTSRDDLYTRRATLLELFTPTDDPLKLRWTLTSRTRQIDVYYAGDMAMGSGDRGGFTQRVAVTLRADDPTFYDPTAESVTFALGGGSDSLEVPLEVPMVVGSSTLDATNTITYNGNWRSYPQQIRVTGPITDAVITNSTTGEVLDFTGATIAGGDYYDIDLRYGYKTVTDSSGANQIADLTDDSDLATWHLAAAPDAAGGVNSINVTGSSVTEATKVEVTYFERYTGI